MLHGVDMNHLSIYDAAADKVKAKGLMKMGKIDATVETALAKRYGVKGYPTPNIYAELHKYMGSVPLTVLLSLQRG